MAEDRLKESKTFFTEGNMNSDAVIQMEDHELHVDLNIISLMSSTLAGEFQPRPDPNSLPGETNKAVAKLVGPVDHFVDLLTSIYPNFRSVNVVNKDNVEYLLPLAAKYKLLFLLRRCEKYIVEAVSRMQCKYYTCNSIFGSNSNNYSCYDRDDIKRLMRYFALANQTNLEARKHCMDKLVTHSYSVNRKDKDNVPEPTRHTAAFKQLDPTTRWEILRNRVFYLEGTYGKVTDNVEDL
ncbi:uncharacterized protein LOC124262431 isoform X2 [Haliotis rubra]|uniref:uncharacterized protein LOC124262431 isoform X2 n=1 Tax=Haliotis rubra TaxID=36100 RepID=UPI001EE61D67|nr:uncharacterized protein LOC124262431 isoform X2 [Haliotis rubra]